MTTKTIILAGKIWNVSLLVAKQNRIIDPIILKLLPQFIKWNRHKRLFLDAESYQNLLEMAFVAISRDHANVTREQFLELPITLPELIAAFSIIAEQTGIFQKSGNQDEENLLGEQTGV